MMIVGSPSLFFSLTNGSRVCSLDMPLTYGYDRVVAFCLIACWLG